MWEKWILYCFFADRLLVNWKMWWLLSVFCTFEIFHQWSNFSDSHAITDAQMLNLYMQDRSTAYINLKSYVCVSIGSHWKHLWWSCWCEGRRLYTTEAIYIIFLYIYIYLLPGYQFASDGNDCSGCVFFVFWQMRKMRFLFIWFVIPSSNGFDLSGALVAG